MPIIFLAGVLDHLAGHSAVRSYANVSTRRVLDRPQLAGARGSRKNAPEIEWRHPLVPQRPPRTLMGFRPVKPFVWRRGELVVGPMAVLAAGRADDAGHVSRGREDEFDRPGIEAGRCIGRFPRRDVILARREMSAS